MGPNCVHRLALKGGEKMAPLDVHGFALEGVSGIPALAREGLANAYLRLEE